MKENNVLKKRKYDKGYTTIDNHSFKNKNLSLRAKGLLSLMWSLPDNWNFNEKGLAKLSTDGTTSLRSGLKELEEQGYLIRNQIRHKGQFKGWEYNLSDIPHTVKPNLDEPSLGKPISVNKDYKLSIDKELNDKVKTNIKNYTKKEINFDCFWNAYPKKVSKGQALKTFNKVVKDEETLNLILADLDKRKRFKQWTDNQGQFIPYPSSYLNNQGWLDEYEAEKEFVRMFAIRGEE